MSPPLIKLCGINTLEAARLVGKLDVAYMGVVFYPRSPRNISVELAAELKTAAGVPVIAVTVDPEDALLDNITKHLRPEGLQLHGSETPERLAALRARYGAKVKLIKAIGVRGPQDIGKAAAFAGVADMLLFDAKPPQDDGLPGGNGLAFDWRLLHNQGIALPWFLSGGLNGENIVEAVSQSGARMVDVSSGIEIAPGVKDAALMRAFVEKAKSA